MHLSVRSKIAPLLCLVVITTMTVDSSPATAATSVNRCESIFYNDLQRLPKPSAIAIAREGEVHSMPGQAALMLKIRQVLPPGRYGVVVRDQNGTERADVLTIATTLGTREGYPHHGLEFKIGSTTVVRTEPTEVSFSRTAGREGDVQGMTTRMRLESRPDANQLILVNSEFTGNSTSPEGIFRRDTSVELAITRRSNVALVVKQNVRSSVANSGVDVGINTGFVVDVIGPVKTPSTQPVH